MSDASDQPKENPWRTPTHPASARGSTRSRWPPSCPAPAVQNLRVYERRGLVEPHRTEGGTRRYSDDDLDRIRRVVALLDAGLNLAGIALVLELEDDNERLRSRAIGSGLEVGRPGGPQWSDDHARTRRRARPRGLPGAGQRRPVPVPDRDLDDEVFVVSGMSIEVSDLRVRQRDAVQRHRRVGAGQHRPGRGDLAAPRGPDARRAGRPVPAAGVGDRRLRVVLASDRREVRHVDIDAERAYARALLSVLA